MNIKKVTQKGADGSSITYEFDVPKMQDVPAHPGGPKGTDTVPAWLTPGEFVMNAEATRMFEPQIEAMNDAGRSMQLAQGGTIPEYKADGGDVVPPGYTDEDVALEGYLNSIPLVPERPQELTDQLNQTNPNLVPQEVDLTNAVDMSPLSLVADEVSSQEYKTPYDPRINPNRVQVPVQREDRSLLETLFGPAGSILPLGYTDKAEAEEDLVTLKTQRDNAVESGNVDIATSLDAKIKDKQGIIDSSNTYNQEVATARSINTTRDLNDQIERVVYSNASDEDKSTALAGLGLVSEDIDKVLKDKSTVRDITKGNEQDAILDSVIQVKDAIAKTKDVPNPDTDDVSDEKVIAEGNDLKVADPTMWDSVTNWLSNSFKDLIDDDKLMNAGLLYLGSRAMGYSHDGSLNFVGKRYLGQIDSKLKVADQAMLSNKYTRESVKKYRDTGKVEDLIAKTSWSDSKVDIYTDNSGKTYNVVTQKSADGKLRHFNVDSGKPVDIRKLELNKDRTQRLNSAITSNSKLIRAEFNARIPKDSREELEAILPTPEALATWSSSKFVEMGLNPNQSNKVLADVTRNMINDVKSNPSVKLTEASFVPYLNERIMTMSLEQQGLAKEFSGVSPETIATTLGLNINQEDPVAVQREIKDLGVVWNSLTSEGKSYYTKRRTEGKPPILVLLDEVNRGVANKDFFNIVQQ